MSYVRTVLICICEHCGYGRADHPETMRKPWVADVMPWHCEGCGSLNWDASMNRGTQVALRVKLCVDRISYALGFRCMPPRRTIKRPSVTETTSTRSQRSRVDVTGRAH